MDSCMHIWMYVCVYVCNVCMYLLLLLLLLHANCYRYCMFYVCYMCYIYCVQYIDYTYRGTVKQLRLLDPSFCRFQKTKIPKTTFRRALDFKVTLKFLESCQDLISPRHALHNFKVTLKSYLPTYVHIYLCAYSPICVYTYVHVPTYLVYLSAYLPIYIFTYIPIHRSPYIPIYIRIYPLAQGFMHHMCR